MVPGLDLSSLRRASFLFALHLGVRPILTQLDRWTEKGRFPIEDRIVHSYAIEKVPSRSQLFRSSSPTRASRRKSRLFQRDARIRLLDRKSF